MGEKVVGQRCSLRILNYAAILLLFVAIIINRLLLGEKKEENCQLNCFGVS